MKRKNYTILINFHQKKHLKKYYFNFNYITYVLYSYLYFILNIHFHVISNTICLFIISFLSYKKTSCQKNKKLYIYISDLINTLSDQRITNTPTPMNMALMGSFPASLAAKGAAAIPPITNPKMTCQWLNPKNAKKVRALAKVMKNSDKLTVPITNLGVFPLEIKVVVTSGPQPPPPKESKNPPKKANQPTFFSFLDSFFFLAKTLTKILTPNKKV